MGHNARLWPILRDTEDADRGPAPAVGLGRPADLRTWGPFEQQRLKAGVSSGSCLFQARLCDVRGLLPGSRRIGVRRSADRSRRSPLGDEGRDDDGEGVSTGDFVPA
jgi:hypothetical protein